MCSVLEWFSQCLTSRHVKTMKEVWLACVWLILSVALRAGAVYIDDLPSGT